MTKVDTGDGMVFDTDTGILIVDGIDEPIQTESISNAAKEGLNEWHDIFGGKNKD